MCVCVRVCVTVHAHSHGEGRQSQALSDNMLREMRPTALPGLEGPQLPSGCPQEVPPSPGKLEVSLAQLGHPRVSITPSSPSWAHEVSSHCSGWKARRHPDGPPLTPTSKPSASPAGFIFKICPESSHFSPSLCHHPPEPPASVACITATDHQLLPCRASL